MLRGLAPDKQVLTYPARGGRDRVDVTVWTFPARPGPDRHSTVVEVLAHALGVAPACVQIDRRCRHCGDPDHGKPTVAGAPGFSFSVSHSGALLAVAVVHGAQVGVDVEEVRPRRHLDRLAARVLTPAEHARWEALPAEARLDAFLRHWTEREAYLKAIGLGLRGPLRDALAGSSGWAIVPVPGLVGAIGSVAVDSAARVTTRPFAPVR